MNDQSQMMNQHQVNIHSNFMLKKNYQKSINQSEMIASHSQMLNQSQMVNQQPPQMAPNQAQMVNQLNQMVNQGANPMMVSQSKMMTQNKYGGQWSQPHTHGMPPLPMNAMKFANPMNQMYGGVSKPGRGNWKGKKPMDKRKDGRRKDKTMPGGAVGVGGGGMAVSGTAAGGYQPPTLYELEQQNRLKARRFYHPKKKFNRMGPYAHAPRNTTSYLIRAKKSGGIASLVSPCPVTPAVLPTPVFSPSREALVDMAKEEWGVDGYGSMKGLIRLRSPGHDEAVDDYEDEDEGGSSESDVEEHVEVERRLDHDLSRFEMIYPNSGVDYHNVLENRVDDQDTHIAQLEEENLILKERLYLMERELGELRRRLLCLERQNQVVEDINEEVVENVSENDSEGLRNILLLGNKHNEEVDYVPRDEAGESESKRDDGEEMLHRGLSELVVKDVFEGNTTTNELKDEGKQDVGLVNEGLVVDLMGDDNKGDKLGEEQVQELNVGQNEEHAFEDKKNVRVAGETEVGSVGTEVGSVGETAKSLPNVDACMGEGMTVEASECDQPEGLHEETRKHDEAGTQAKGENETLKNEAAVDVSMEDALVMNKEVKDD